MIAILLVSSLLLILGLICTIFSGHPTTKKFIALCFFQSLASHETANNNNPPKTNQSSAKQQPLNESNPTPTPTTTSKSEQLKGVFATFDKNKDGYITKQELEESLNSIGISADVSDMLQKLDSNGDGLIDLDEFCEMFEEDGIGNRDKEGELREAFDVFDENKDGVITVEELGLVLGSLGFTEGKMLESCKEMIRKVDVDGDGKVNFHEFKIMMRSGFGNNSRLLVPVS